MILDNVFAMSNLSACATLHTQRVMPLVTAPVIARLNFRTRLWGFTHLMAGDFGRVVRRKGRAELVDLSHIEHPSGQAVTTVQLAAASMKSQEEP